MSSKISICTEKLSCCPFCGSKLISRILLGNDCETGTGKYGIDSCNDCGIYFTNPRPTESDIEKLYIDRVSPDFVQRNKFFDVLRKISVKRDIKKILSRFPKNLAILDYGCGDGFFTANLSKNLSCKSIMAMDFHTIQPAYISDGNSIKYVSFKNKSLPQQHFFDIIICRHVIEHVVDPIKTVNELQNYLKKGGAIVLEVPNFMSIWRKIFGKYYFGLYLPRHLYHFTTKNILLLFRNFNKIHIEASNTPVLGKSIGYLFGFPLKNIGMNSIFLYPLQLAIDKIFGSSSLIRVIAHKN